MSPVPHICVYCAQPHSLNENGGDRNRYAVLHRRSFIVLGPYPRLATPRISAFLLHSLWEESTWPCVTESISTSQLLLSTGFPCLLQHALCICDPVNNKKPKHPCNLLQVVLRTSLNKRQKTLSFGALLLILRGTVTAVTLQDNDSGRDSER